jgi:hypothetical protein
MEYYEWLAENFSPQCSDRRLRLKDIIGAYELGLSRHLLVVLSETPGVTLYGLIDDRHLT